MSETTQRLPTVNQNVLSLALGGVFIWFAFQKLGSPVDFLKAIREYEILPPSPVFLTNGVGIWIPWLELFAGVALWIPRFRKASAWVMACFLVVFTAAVLFRALEEQARQGIAFCEVAFDCGCGTGVTLICTKLAENAVLIATSWYLAIRTPAQTP